MMPRKLARIARMDAAEIVSRGTTAARTMRDRVRARLSRPQWNRDDLLSVLASSPEATAARSALAARRWNDAHAELSRHFVAAPQRFVIAPASRHTLVERIGAVFPGSANHAAARADRIVAGEYDVLGYRALRFVNARPDRPDVSERPDRRDLTLPDWQLDPVSHRRPPMAFWADVPFLDPACGDHKVIWELNRHQHWIALGRAYWLTGEARYRDRCLAELAGWLDANPPLVGVNWASMLELALRSISWVWAINLFVERPAEAGRQVRDAGFDRSPWLVDLLVALDRQLTHVERNLSYYFSPNTHLLGEALALYVAGAALPELSASPRRAALGRRILLAEIDRQIAPDGGHAERSTHYHRYALDFYTLALVVARLTGDEATARFEEVVGRLGFAARLLADDRGRLPHIGDDDGGALLPMTGRAPDDLRDSLAIAAALTGRPDLQIGRAPEEALWMLSGLAVQSPIPNPQSPPSAALRDTGYYVSRSSAGDHLLIDGGPHGYQNAGHAHADALSLTLAVRGLPLLIDPGTACYTTDPALRDRMRSTALHNTLTLDERAQSAPSGPFHWARVANARVAAWRANDAFDYFDGAHDGYAPVEHRRRVLALHGDLVVVADLVSGAGTHTAAVHWHVDPQWTVDVRRRRVAFTRPGERVALVVPQGIVERFTGDSATGLGWYSPAYGSLERTTTIRITHSGAAPFWIVSVFDLSPDNAIAEVDWMPVWAEAGTTAHATAIQIARAVTVDYVLFAEPAEGGGARGVSDDGRARGSSDAGARGVLAGGARSVVAGGARGFQPSDDDNDDRARRSPERLALHGDGALRGDGALHTAARDEADSAVKRRPTWRVGEFETDARMLFCRVGGDRPVARLAMVDGSLVRTPGRRGLQFALPRVVPDLHLDFAADVRIAGPAFGARLVVGGQELPIELDRRAAPRAGDCGIRDSGFRIRD